jgi:hypothetical protein
MHPEIDALVRLVREERIIEAARAVALPGTSANDA